jgi:hypothetical protein
LSSDANVGKDFRFPVFGQEPDGGLGRFLHRCGRVGGRFGVGLGWGGLGGE